MYEVLHRSRSDTFCFCQTLARSIFELASHNKCHYAVLNKNKCSTDNQSRPTAELWGCPMLIFPAGLPAASSSCLFHAVFRRQGAADFPFNPSSPSSSSCRSKCQSNGYSYRREAEGGGGAAAQTPLFRGK